MPQIHRQHSHEHFARARCTRLSGLAERETPGVFDQNQAEFVLSDECVEKPKECNLEQNMLTYITRHLYQLSINEFMIVRLVIGKALKMAIGRRNQVTILPLCWSCSHATATRASDILQLIGNTPMLEVRGFNTGPSRLYLKLESQNPQAPLKPHGALHGAGCRTGRAASPWRHDH